MALGKDVMRYGTGGGFRESADGMKTTESQQEGNKRTRGV